MSALPKCTACIMYIWAYGQSKVISNYVEIVGCRDINVEITGFSMIIKTVFCWVLRSISTNGGLLVMGSEETGYECIVKNSTRGENNRIIDPRNQVP